jgi:hypothetical protein
MDLPHDDRPEHMSLTFISLSFLPNLGFCQKKNSDKTVTNTYFVVVLVNKNITIKSPYTKYVLLNVSYPTKLRWVNQIIVGFFNGPQFINIFEKNHRNRN